MVLIGTAKAYLQLEFQTSENPFSFPLLPSLRPFPFPLLFSCSLPTPLNPSHSSTLPSLRKKSIEYYRNTVENYSYMKYSVVFYR